MIPTDVSWVSLGLLPLMWSALIWGVRKIFHSVEGDDFQERLLLLVMLAPFPISVLAALSSPFMPSSTSPVPIWIGDTLDQPVADAFIVVQNKIPFPELNLTLAFGLVWIAIALFGLGRLVAELFKIRQMEASATTHASGMFLVSGSCASAIASPSGRIIVSERLLSSLSQTELDLIVAHEQAHSQRHDPIWFIIFAILDRVFWFNPWLRSQTAKCRQSAELSCDAHVLLKNPGMHSVYASTLLTALRHTAGNARPCVPAVFSVRRKGDYRMRMEHIMQKSERIGKQSAKPLALTLAILAVPLALTQFSLAQPNGTFSIASYPVDGRLTSSFGERKHPITGEIKHHNGLDIAAPTGTPVYTRAAGKVDFAAMKGGYGNLVQINHGNGTFTRYAQLDEINVSVGDSVGKDELIGKVGMSGTYATGPHLHFEVIVNDVHQDPASFLATE